ncbi:MAG: cytochrome C [Thermodesulfobacteriota bacterium]|jgi:hypothetical protein|nr:cytochrome C [Thermodesulfobacteriota bacterium]
MPVVKRFALQTLLVVLALVGFMAVAACARPDVDDGRVESETPPAAAVEVKQEAAEMAAEPEEADSSAVQVALAEKTAEPAPTAQKKAPANPYDADIPPMNLEQCGQCHPTYFESLRTEGGRHQFDCRECHEVFHAYNPQKQNWAEIMPDCADCHGQPHGEVHVQCLTCHVNPHAPLSMPYAEGAPVTKACADCHTGPAREVAEFPSRHTDVACTSCHHDQHGYVPSCFECHGPHYEGQALESCTECHPVHKPLEIALTPTTGARTCQACHGTVYTEWKETPSKHGQVNCSLCHTEHGMIPDCRTCHVQPHSDNMLSKFPDCLTCHINPHDLPIKRKN